MMEHLWNFPPIMETCQHNESSSYTFTPLDTTLYNALMIFYSTVVDVFLGIKLKDSLRFKFEVDWEKIFAELTKLRVKLISSDERGLTGLHLVFEFAIIILLSDGNGDARCHHPGRSSHLAGRVLPTCAPFTRNRRFSLWFLTLS